MAAGDSSSGGPASPGVARVAAELTREHVSIASAPEVAHVVAGMGALNADLHRTSAPIDDNWTVSPLSVALAFGMLRAGCRGSSAREIDAVFRFPAGSVAQGTAHAALNALAGHLVTTEPIPTTPRATPSEHPAPPPIVAIANGLFLDRSYTGMIEREYLAILATQYGAGPEAVSFADPAAADAINDWVARQTRDRIKKLFDRLAPETVLVLANAVYLKATWLRQFSEHSTTDGPFTAPDGRAVPARLMHEQFESVRYTAGDGWQRVSLPYVGNEVAMRIVLPARPAADVASLAPALAAASQPGLDDQPARVDLTLPKWDTATDLPLVPALSRLGISDVFGPRADLRGIAPNLFVSDAIHRANITVDESGTEAAAVTGMALRATALREGAPIVMRADRPFAWAVVHEPTGTPIFTGHVTNPGW